MLVPDLVRALASPPANFSVAAIAREALTVPETMKADELLRQMRRHRTHQAIVIDEYGGTAGLVTFERVMERIVGELGGDFGTGASTPIRQLPDGSAEVDGLALVTDINEQFGLEIDEDTYTTLGGYMLGRLGRRPKIGDAIEVGGRTLRVEAVDGLRVSRVRIISVRPQQPHSVRDHQQRRAHVGHHRHPQRRRADDGQGEKHRFQAERQRDVHLNIARASRGRGEPRTESSAARRPSARCPPSRARHPCRRLPSRCRRRPRPAPARR